MTLITGFLSGLALVAPVGPVTLALLSLGAERGRRAALAGAGGVVSADLLLLPATLLAADSIEGLDPFVFRLVEIIIGVALLAMAAFGLLRTDAARRAVAGIRRPGRTLFAVALCNPMALATWAGLVLALPDSLRQNGGLGPFFVGILLASAVWHGILALAGDWFGPRLGRRGHQRLVRLSSALLALVGTVLLVG